MADERSAVFAEGADSIVIDVRCCQEGIFGVRLRRLYARDVLWKAMEGVGVAVGCFGIDDGRSSGITLGLL